MATTRSYAVDPERIHSPAYVIEARLLRQNLELLQGVQREAGVHIILALKAFAGWPLFPTFRYYLAGATASSLHEARLINEEMGRTAHTYAVAYAPEEFDELAVRSSHLTFNSVSQLERYRERLANYPGLKIGLRINPEYSSVETELYNPAARGSRLGEPADKLGTGLPPGVTGLHFHTLCESSSQDLADTLQAVEAKFGHLLPQISWMNLGGGHLITRSDYDVPHLIATLKAFKAKWNLALTLEPGSAALWQTGTLVTRVLDIHEAGGTRTAILNASFTAHMPDTLEMPYRPAVTGAASDGNAAHRYRLGGLSCLAGDYLEAYGFDAPLRVGDPVVFEDMIHYTLVKTTMFNGVPHPSIVLLHEDGRYETLREFGYADYKNRMG